MNAPPTPWTILAAISAPTDGATPHNTDATTVTTSPNVSSRRFPKWSAKLPESSNNAATASRYPVSVHCTALTLASRSRPIAGTATLTTFASKKAIPDASAVVTISATPPELRNATCDSSTAIPARWCDATTSAAMTPPTRAPTFTL